MNARRADAMRGAGNRRWRTGVRFEIAPALSLDLEATRRERATAHPDHGIAARGRLHW